MSEGERITTDYIPDAKADWPCNTPVGDKEAERLPPRLVHALYLLLRDHVQPGDVEQIMLHVRDAQPDTIFTNEHLIGYARSLAKYLAPTYGGIQVRSEPSGPLPERV